MADPTKLAALQQLAETGSFEGQQAALGQSQADALSRQSTLGGLIGAPAQATASTMPTVSEPYGRFSTALSQYADSYAQSAANRASAQDTYMAQVADAQAAHRAEANRAIAEAQAAHARSSSGSSGYDDLSQWEIEALAEGQGQIYQQEAAAAEGQNAAQNQGEAQQAQQLDAFRQMGDEDARSERAIEYALRKDGPTDDERARAEAQWNSEHPPSHDELLVLNGMADSDQARQIAERRAQERDAFVKEYAGSDRIGLYSERRQAYLDSLNPDADVQINGQMVGTAPQGSSPSEVQQYADVRNRAAEESIQNQMMLEMYRGPEFTRQAALDLNLRPDLTPDLQERLYAGMFPDLTPEEQMDNAKAQRELEYFNRTGFSSPGDQRSWEEAERKNAGIPDANNRQVRRPDDPDVLSLTGLAPTEVERIRQDPKWEEALSAAETYIDPPDDELTGVQSPAALKAMLEADEFDPTMIDLLIAMYAPSMVG